MKLYPLNIFFLPLKSLFLSYAVLSWYLMLLIQKRRSFTHLKQNSVSLFVGGPYCIYDAEYILRARPVIFIVSLHFFFAIWRYQLLNISSLFQLLIVLLLSGKNKYTAKETFCGPGKVAIGTTQQRSRSSQKLYVSHNHQNVFIIFTGDYHQYKKQMK